MRVVPARYLTPDKPILSKRSPAAKVQHLSAPLKGLSLSSKLSSVDPMTATVLENVIIEEDRIRRRFGMRLALTHAAHKPVWCLVPYYGGANRLAAATDGKLIGLDGSVYASGFTSDDWHWTSFSNLSAVEYTVMVNGTDGVWSWDGATTSSNPAAVPVTKLTKSPGVGQNAVATVGAADISKFHEGDVVLIAGAVGTGMVNANGYHTIYSVGVPANTFTIAGADTSTGAADLTTGVTADPPGTGIIKEVVTAPTYATYIVPNQFNIVVSHMNRLFFADKTNLSVYYLPLQQKSGIVAELPLNAVFKRGGYIRAMYTWTVDGGAGLNDMLVVFSSNGECVIYQGLDPDSDFSLQGIYRFDSPMSKHSVINYGGELHVFISTGFVPMSTLMKAEVENLGLYDKNVYSLFQENSRNGRQFPGWSAFLNPNTGRAILNMPQGGANQYTQYVRAMQNPAWTHWTGLPARCWGWINSMVYFGSDDGRVYEFDPKYLSDQDNMGNRIPIKIDIQWAWHSYGSSSIKQFKMVLPYIITDGLPKPFLDFRVDYDSSLAYNQPDVTEADDGATWGVAEWEESPVDTGWYWASGVKNWRNWNGIAAIGRVGAPRLTAYISNCEFSISGIDVLFEQGGVFG
jgi:hypothetical protein